MNFRIERTKNGYSVMRHLIHTESVYPEKDIIVFETPDCDEEVIRRIGTAVLDFLNERKSET